MLAVRLDPVKTERVQKRGETLKLPETRQHQPQSPKSGSLRYDDLDMATHLHDTQNPHSQRQPQEPHDCERDPPNNTLHAEHIVQGHAPQDFGQLRMRERQRPEPEVRSCVRDASEAELDRVDDLVDHDFAEVVMFLSFGTERMRSALIANGTLPHLRLPRRPLP